MSYEISQSEEYLCVAINSIMNMNTYSTTAVADGDMAHDLWEYNTQSGVVNYSTSIVASESSSNNYYVVKISDGNITVYRYIKLYQ